jgi:hypothetical protein
MRFYRGIAVPSDSAATTITEIRAHGLEVRDSGFRSAFQDLKPHLDRFWSLPRIISSDLELVPRKETSPRVCACAHKTGAAFYACKKNINVVDNASIVVTFEADISDVIVDGRDFLFTLFQLGDPDLARPIAERLFGKAVLRYVDRAFAADKHDQGQRIALCHLAVQDDEVILAHAGNSTVIGGRYGTEFCSAFLVRLPVASHRIVAVEQVPMGTVEFPEPEITLPMICP